MNQATAEKPLDEIKQGTSQMQQDSASNPLPTTGNTPETPTPRDNPQTGPQSGPASGNGGQNNASQTGSAEDQPNLDLIMKIPVDVQVILGTTKMPVSKLMKLGRNAVIALDRQVGDAIDVVVNGRIVARGEVVLMEDDSSRFGISLTEIVDPNAPEE